MTGCAVIGLKCNALDTFKALKIKGFGLWSIGGLILFTFGPPSGPLTARKGHSTKENIYLWLIIANTTTSS